MQNNLSSKTKSNRILRQSTLNLGICVIVFQQAKQKNEEGKSESVMIMLAGRKPKISGARFNIFTLGFKIIRYGKRMKIGIIKRKQTLQKI